MVFCLCTPFTCEDEGLISVAYNGSSGTRVVPGTNTLIPGAATGNVTINGYAFEKGEDKWLGVRCPSSAQGTQTNYIKYDGCADKFRIIPSRVNSAVLTGDEMNDVTFIQFSDCGVIQSTPSSLQNGVTITQQTTTRFGHNLIFKNIGFPSLTPKRVFGANLSYLQSLAISSNFPQPATFTANFQFIVDC